LTARILGGAKLGHTRSELVRVCAPSAFASAFVANTPVVAMLAPRVILWCRRTGRSPSRYLMPLSYAVILGGSMTMIGGCTLSGTRNVLKADATSTKLASTRG
jgi:Na+/H+ antiporter NhaD/arsenite permease-like protein